MKKLSKRSYLKCFGGVAVGFISGLLGAGGGMLAVPLLEKLDIKGKKSHANAVAVILPLALVSAVFYYLDKRMTLSDAAPFMIPGIIGSACATFLLKKISVGWLKIIFSGFMLWAGMRLLIR